ncbi:DnaJ homolog subfamily B member 13 [Linum grandiflorum]
MNEIHSLRYTPPDNPSTTTTTATTPNGFFKQKTKEDFLRTITSPLSRITSKRSPSPSPTPSTLSRNNTTNTNTSTSTNKAASSLTRDVSQRSNAVFSRNPSERSTTPIMFSNSTGRKVKPPPVQKNLDCTLEELFYGCTKKVKVTRDVLTDRQIVQEEEILSIEVKPGWRKGTKITFEGMGNERPGAEPADVTFVIAEKRHSLFRREGDDLEIAVEIPLVQALTGCDISIPLMSETGETMNLMIQDVIYPGYKKVIPGQGMPKSKHINMRGNLKVTFLVEFPDELTEEQRSQVVSILEGSS